MTLMPKMTRLVPSRSSARLFSTKPNFIKIVEVGPRDGLQNEPVSVSTRDKANLIISLADCGLRTIEATAFVSPKWVPQMSDNAKVLALLTLPHISLPCLVPNMAGLDQAIMANVREIAVFGAASESFSRKNINCSTAESLDRFRPVVQKALEHNIRVRGYVSTVVWCPYDGRINPDNVARMASRLFEMGCYEISLGDTIGAATPNQYADMLRCVKKHVPVESLAAHCHNTYGMAIANVLASLDEGVTTIDSSVAGLGGCPFAKGASGNTATEDVVYLLNGMGLDTGVDLDKLITVGQNISKIVNKPYQSNAGRALAALRAK